MDIIKLSNLAFSPPQMQIIPDSRFRAFAPLQEEQPPLPTNSDYGDSEDQTYDDGNGPQMKYGGPTMSGGVGMVSSGVELFADDLDEVIKLCEDIWQIAAISFND